jgi:hypothetical protein
MYGDYELSAFEILFNGNNNCKSNVNYDCYRIPKEGGKNALTNLKNRNFTITELEVWSIKEIVRITIN